MIGDASMQIATTSAAKPTAAPFPPESSDAASASPTKVWERETTPASDDRLNNVLVVDDSPVDRRLAGVVVKSNAVWTTAYATNGREALEVIRQSPPDLVLTDLLMPEMDGLALVEEIHARYPSLPVILMTAHGSEEVALQALRAGAVSYVPKKWLARDLIPAIDQALAARKASRRVGRVLEAHQNEVQSACAKVGLEDS